MRSRKTKIGIQMKGFQDLHMCSLSSNPNMNQIDYYRIHGDGPFFLFRQCWIVFNERSIKLLFNRIIVMMGHFAYSNIQWFHRLDLKDHLHRNRYTGRNRRMMGILEEKTQWSWNGNCINFVFQLIESLVRFRWFIMRFNNRRNTTWKILGAYYWPIRSDAIVTSYLL